MIETLMLHSETGEKTILYINSAHISAFMPSGEPGWISVLMSNGVIYDVQDSIPEFAKAVEREQSRRNVIIPVEGD